MTKGRGINRPRWSPDAAAVEVLRRDFATTKTADLAQRLGVAYHQVAKAAARLGLRKDEGWLNGPEGGRTDGSRGLGTRFQAGQRGWNHGMKLGSDWGKATQFRPGQKPPNYLPVGSLRVASSGYLQIKLHDTGYPPRDWVMYHRHVWERAHGPVPQHHLIVFRDGRRRVEPDEVTVDVLECISREESMRRHSVHTYGPEVAQLIQLRGALSRVINRRAKAQETEP